MGCFLRNALGWRASQQPDSTSYCAKRDPSLAQDDRVCQDMVGGSEGYILFFLNKDTGAGVLHPTPGFLTPFGCYRAGSLFDEYDFESFSTGIQDRHKHTHIFCKTGDPQVPDAILAKLQGQARLVEG